VLIADYKPVFATAPGATGARDRGGRDGGDRRSDRRGSLDRGMAQYDTGSYFDRQDPTLRSPRNCEYLY